MKRTLWICLLLTLTLAFLTACGGGDVSYAPGTYTGQSSGDEELDGDYVVVTLTIGDEGTITDAVVETYEANGTLKDEEYGMQQGEVANQDYYDKAQKALAANADYEDAMVEKNGMDGVDTISGATVTYRQLEEAVDIALDKAKE